MGLGHDHRGKVKEVNQNGKGNRNEEIDQVEQFFVEENDEISENSLNQDSQEDDEKMDEETRDFPLCAYALLNLFLSSWGLIGLIMTIGHQSHKITDKILQVDQGSLNLPPYCVYASTSLAILTGMTALIFLLVESDMFFSLFPHINGLTASLCIMATLSAAGGWAGPNVHKYQRILEADVFSRHSGDKTYIKILGQEYDGYWDRLQDTLHCCGLEGPHNWIKSSCHCIPTSCCDDSKRIECQNRITEWTNSGSPNYHNFSHVSDYLWPKNCMDQMTREIEHLKRDWISLPAILLFFHLIVIFNINYIVVGARNRYNVTGAFIAMSKFKEKVKKKIFCLHCKSNKVSSNDQVNDKIK